MKANPRLQEATRLVLLIIITLSFEVGCAVHYYDEKTDTEHLWGIGHMKMKLSAPNEGLQAAINGIDVVGLSIGNAYDQHYLTLGKHSLQRMDIVAENSAVRIEWPDADYVNVRIGSAFPDVPSSVKLLRENEERGQCLEREAQE